MTLSDLEKSIGSLAATEEQFLSDCVRNKQAQIVWFRDKRDAELAHVADTFNSYMEVLEAELASLTRHATNLGVRFDIPEDPTTGATANGK